jgi:hypothetical protein
MPATTRRTSFYAAPGWLPARRAGLPSVLGGEGGQFAVWTDMPAVER